MENSCNEKNCSKSDGCQRQKEKGIHPCDDEIICTLWSHGGSSAPGQLNPLNTGTSSLYAVGNNTEFLAGITSTILSELMIYVYPLSSLHIGCLTNDASNTKDRGRPIL